MKMLNLFIVLAIANAVGAQCPSGYIQLDTSDTLSTKVNSSRSPSKFCFTGGVYRNQSITPRGGDVYVVAAGATADMNGSVVIPSSQFAQTGRLWIAPTTAELQTSATRGTCATSSPKCNQPNDLFLDNVALIPQSSKANVTAHGQWFFDSTNGEIVLFDDPTGHTVELSTTAHAFVGSTDNVTINGASSASGYGLIVEKYAAPTSTGAIEECPGPCSNNWTVENTEIRLNHAYGLSVGKASTTLKSNIHHNGQSGVGANGGPNILVQNTEIAFNNTLGYDYNWEAGGSKFHNTSNLVLKGNYVHDNKGPGLWSDGDNIYVTYDSNTLANNVAAGILHEISFDAVIKNNTSKGDGYGTPGTSCYWGSAIAVNDSPNVEIYGNTIVNGQNGICAEQSDRGSSRTHNQPYRIENLNVHNNTIIQNSSTATATAIVQIGTGNAVYAQWNNRCNSNTYIVANPSTSSLFRWMDKAVSFAQWQSYGNDIRGSIAICSSENSCQ